MPAIEQKTHVACADRLGQFHHSGVGADKGKAVSRSGSC